MRHRRSAYEKRQAYNRRVQRAQRRRIERVERMVDAISQEYLKDRERRESQYPWRPKLLAALGAARRALYECRTLA